MGFFRAIHSASEEEGESVSRPSPRSRIDRLGQHFPSTVVFSGLPPKVRQGSSSRGGSYPSWMCVCVSSGLSFLDGSMFFCASTSSSFCGHQEENHHFGWGAPKKKHPLLSKASRGVPYLEETLSSGNLGNASSTTRNPRLKHHLKGDPPKWAEKVICIAPNKLGSPLKELGAER